MARSFDRIADFVQYLSGQVATLPAVERMVLERAGALVQHEAQSAIGTYRYGWPQLAESTQKDRVRKGFPANEPLLRTGEMERSIEHTVRGRTAHVGSNSQIAVYQELGTSRIPPRPFLSGAAARKGAQFSHMVGKAIAAHLSGEDAERAIGAGPPIL